MRLNIFRLFIFQQNLFFIFGKAVRCFVTRHQHSRTAKARFIEIVFEKVQIGFR